MPMYNEENQIEEKLDELLSLVRVLDTKLRFLQDDIDQLKEDMTQVKFLAENPPAPEMSEEEARKRWKVETF
jgi:hypothetical protein